MSRRPQAETAVLRMPLTESPRVLTWLRPWMWKSAGVLYGLYVFAVMAAYITVANRSVNYSYTVVGHQDAAVGQNNALRVGVYDYFRGRYVSNCDVEVGLGAGEQYQTLFKGKTSPAGFAEVLVSPPGPAGHGSAWQILGSSPDAEAELVHVPVNLVPFEPVTYQPAFEAAAQRQETLEEARAKSKLDKIKTIGTGPLRIEMLAEGGQASDGLRSRYFVEVTDRVSGAPVKAEVTLSKVKGMLDAKAPESVQTGFGGIAAFTTVPIGRQTWKLSARTLHGPPDEALSEREVVVGAKPKQYGIKLKSPVWDTTSTLFVGVRSLHDRGALYGDILVGDHWVKSDVTGMGPRGSGFEFATDAIPRPASPDEAWIAQVQVYGHALMPGTAGDARRIVVVNKPGGRVLALRKVLGAAVEAGLHPKTATAILESPYLVTASEEEVELLIAHWLSWLDTPIRAPEFLLDTHDQKKDEIATEKDSTHAVLTPLLVVSLGGGVLIIFAVVSLAFVRMRAQTARAMAEFGDPDEGAPPAGLARMESVLQLVMIGATLIVFCVSLVVLLRHL